MTPKSGVLQSANAQTGVRVLAGVAALVALIIFLAPRKGFGSANVRSRAVNVPTVIWRHQE